jgi:hypothetical protein
MFNNMEPLRRPDKDLYDLILLLESWESDLIDAQILEPINNN